MIDFTCDAAYQQRDELQTQQSIVYIGMGLKK